jgi:hypothetical protein
MRDCSFCEEFYLVEKSIEVVVKIAGESERIRIDALRSHSGDYSTKAYSRTSADDALDQALGFLSERVSQ